MTRLNIGGVPEHFNYPIHWGMEQSIFAKNGLDINWKDFPGGTGAMNAALRAGEVDLAIVLTEGIVKDIAHGNASKIIQTYVSSPLLWGIHVGANSDLYKEDELQGKRVAVSRQGSGSHLMANVHAAGKNWEIKPDQFIEVGNLDGAIKALTNGKADYFMWEHFTTKPIVDDGLFRRVGDFPTPWPCFVIAARQEVIDSDKDILKTFLDCLNRITKDFKNISNIDARLSDVYRQKLTDIQLWLSRTTWSQEQLGVDTLDNVQRILKDLKHIDKEQDTTRYLTMF